MYLEKFRLDGKIAVITGAARGIGLATADGYPFPANFDTDPPPGGLAPPSQQALLAKAVAEEWTQQQLEAARAEQTAKRRA